MKKNDFTYLAIFLVVALFVIPMSAFLTSEIIGLESTQSIWCRVYIFFKDQGSFIGGTLAFLGVIFVINSQWRSTTRIIDDAAKRSDMDRFESYKDKAYDSMLAIQEVGFNIVPQASTMVKRNQRFITKDLFSESVFSSFRKEYKNVKRFLDRYGEKDKVKALQLIDVWFACLYDMMKYQGAEDLLEDHISLMSQYMLYCSSFPGDTGAIQINGKRYFLKDIIKLAENGNINNLNDMFVFMEIVYAWIRRYAVYRVISDIESTLFCRT